MAKFALFDPKAAPPARVEGWFNTDDFLYANLPLTERLLELTNAEWDARMTGDRAVAGGKLIAVDRAAASARPWPDAERQSGTVGKAVLLGRLGARLRALRGVLKMGVADAELSDDELALRERWDGSVLFESDDGALRAALTAAGGDADALLARG